MRHCEEVMLQDTCLEVEKCQKSGSNESGIRTVETSEDKPSISFARVYFDLAQYKRIRSCAEKPHKDCESAYAHTSSCFPGRSYYWLVYAKTCAR